MVEQRAKSQSRTYYIIGGVAVAVGVIGFIIFVIFLINQVTSSMPKNKVVVPGTQEIHFAEPGMYTVYYEYHSVINNKVYSTGEELPSSVMVTLTSETTGENIMLTQSRMNETYETGGYAGVSIFAFEITDPGKYNFTAHYGDDKEHPEIVLAIGQSKLFGTIFSSLVLFFVSFIIFIGGGVIIIITYFKGRTKKQKPLDEKAATGRVGSQ
jgi:hypothetical protein